MIKDSSEPETPDGIKMIHQSKVRKKNNQLPKQSFPNLSLSNYAIFVSLFLSSLHA